MGALSMKKDIPYSTDLDRRPPHTYQEFLTRAQGFINAEEAKKALKSKATTPAKKEVRQASSQNNGKKRRGPPQVQAEQRYNPALSSRAGNASTSQGENKRPKTQRYDAYTPLTIGIEDVYHEISHLQVLRRPPPLKSDPARRNQNKYCRFHGESGHTIAECYDLRDEVERLIREGRLSEYRADRRNNNNRRNSDRRDEQRHDNPPEPVSVIRTIFGGPYLRGTSRRAQKEYAKEAKEKFSQRVMNVSGREAKAARYEDAEITFLEADVRGVHFPQSDALVVEAMIGNHTVCRILVNNGSSVDILYANCLDKMGIPRTRLQNSAQPLYGFTGDSVIPEGAIELPMTIGDRPHTSIVISKFLVVKGGDQYNAFIGRPTLRALRAVTSIYHQVMKFPTPTGIGKARGNQYESRLTYSETVRHYAEPTQVSERLDEFLKGSLDVFAWTHEDMEGISPGVMCHRLNVDQKFLRKRQKRRPMNAERSEALREEVDKLITNNFIREVLYPEWVSNPVLVKKPNGEW
ncbi:uncharacterized protein LOC112093114 [Morus notabilis]|uniref:uncharacterized protein LOC112093114 n=1 Tax=Morus notabilis TaxID=981085 RepID=UPI000CED5D41|nr:uncharacterized protein LOC112093114 [Morus notabilis]